MCLPARLMMLTGLFVISLSTQANQVSLVPLKPANTYKPDEIIVFSVDIDFSSNDECTLGGGIDIFFDPAVVEFISLEPLDLGDPSFARQPDILNDKLEAWAVGDFNGICEGSMGTASFRVLPDFTGFSEITADSTTNNLVGGWVSALTFAEFESQPDYIDLLFEALGRDVFMDGFERIIMCEPDDEEACYEGPEGTAGIGQCKAGVRICDAQSQWGACTGWVGPDTEICGDSVDNSCNGFEAGCEGDRCSIGHSLESCDTGLGCFISSCRELVCQGRCNVPGSTRDGFPCTQSQDCRLGSQCFTSGEESACLKLCDLNAARPCGIGSNCSPTGIFADGRELGACSPRL